MKQIFFRIIGVGVVFGGLFAFQDFGLEILPIFKSFVAGTNDSFMIFTVLLRPLMLIYQMLAITI